MTERDDKLSARYRELAREEPPGAIDARILEAARAAAAPPARARSSRWMGPVSIAAVLVLGIGVSLRMQMEKPGIETSVPSSSSAEYPAPAAEPAPATEPARAEQKAAPAPKPAAREAEAPPAAKVLRKERAGGPPARADATIEEGRGNVAPEPVPKPFPDAPVTMQATAPPPPAAPPPAAALSAPAMPAPAMPAAATPRAKREAIAADSAVAAPAGRATAVEADPDPVRELERIAKLRADGRHADADRALEQFRRRHPDFRIPEATWERVKPR